LSVRQNYNIQLKNWPSFLLTSLFVLFGGLLLFSRLGTYALWDDEAGTALHGIAVSQTGDTGALVGNNLVAFRNGVALKNLKDRTVSPLQYYVCALFMRFGTTTSLLARVPFSLIGFAALTLMAFRINRVGLEWKAKMIYFLCILLSIPLFLYFRQCRYYSLVLFFELLALFLYRQEKRSRRDLVLLNFALFGLIASNYLAGFALLWAFVFDYVIWERKESPFVLRDICCSALFQFVCCFLLLSIWNPWGTGWGSYIADRGISRMQRIQLFAWTFRDCFRSEFLGFLPCLLAPYVVIRTRDSLLLRALVAVLVIILITSMVSPQVALDQTGAADIRYVISVIPLGIFIATRVILAFSKGRWLWLMGGVLLLQFFNLLNPFRFDRGQGVSTSIGFIREISLPSGDPYRAAADWISFHVPSQASVWVLPDYACYPLMFHAPQAVYAWQLRPEQKNEEQFKNLADIHFQGLVLPDYIVVFGPSVVQIRELLGQWSMQGIHYQEVIRLMTFWKDLYRPELFWRTFKPIENFDPNTEGIYIFKKQS
jgi:hypothetical protein